MAPAWVVRDERLNLLNMMERCQDYVYILFEASLTVVDDAIFQQGLSQVDSFLGFADLSALEQPRHKLAANTKAEGKEKNEDDRAKAKLLIAPHPWT